MHVKIVVLVIKPFAFLTFLLPSSDFKVPAKKDTAGFLHLVIHLMIFFDGASFSFMSPVPNKSMEIRTFRPPAREYLKEALEN